METYAWTFENLAGLHNSEKRKEKQLLQEWNVKYPVHYMIHSAATAGPMENKSTDIWVMSPT